MIKLAQIYDAIYSCDPANNGENRENQHRLYRKKFTQFLQMTGQLTAWPKDEKGAYLVSPGTEYILFWILKESITPDSPLNDMFDQRIFKHIQPEQSLDLFKYIQHGLNTLYYGGQIGEANRNDWEGLFSLILNTERCIFEIDLRKKFNEFCEVSLPLINTIDIGSIVVDDASGKKEYAVRGKGPDFEHPESFLDTDVFTSQSDFFYGMYSFLHFYTEKARQKGHKQICELAKIKSELAVEGTANDYVDNDGNIQSAYIMRDLNIQHYLSKHPEADQAIAASLNNINSVTKYFRILPEQ